MKRKGYKIILVWILVLADLAATAVLAVGVNMGMKSGYSSEMWEDILRGRSWLESAQYEQLAADAVFDALEVAARNSRLERGGAYDPERIIRIRDYLDSRIVYDMVQEEQKKDGICYKLGDLYQWSLKGTNVRQNIFQESYKPLFYNSIQEYANECDEEYNVVVSQIVEAMEVLRKDVAEYQQIKKAWSYEAVNVRFALWDLGSGNVYTNVQELQKTELKQENLEQYFYGMGSYYSFDSRSANVVQKNVGDYYSYNTHALLTGWNAHLMGEYQVYVGIDTGFPVADQFAKGALAYETAKDRVERYAIASAVGALILLCTILGLFWRLSGYVSRLLTEVFAHAGMAVQAGVLFMGYELIQLPLGLLFGKGAVAALATGPEWYSALNAEYGRRARIAEEIMDELGCSVAPGQQGLFLWGRIPDDASGSEAFADSVLDRARVFITPGFIFGSAGERYVRISLCAPEAVLAEALRRIRL